MIKYIKYGLVLIMIIVLTSCNSKAPIQSNNKTAKSTYLLGTLVKITVYADVDDTFFDDIFTYIEDIEKKVSKTIPTSEVALINDNAGKKAVSVSEETFHIIKTGLYYAELSNGLFDISVGPLVDLWGIGTENEKVPTGDELDAVINLTDYKAITIDENSKSVKLEKENMKIDLGGIAKGYVADEVANLIKDYGISSAIINLGGNILTIGTKPNGGNWNIGIQNPFEGRNKELGIIQVGSKSIVTSGIYERFFYEDDIRYHHILDPFTGFPVDNNLAGVTILSDKSIDGDALSTVVFALGLEKGYRIISETEGIEAIFVTKDKEVFLTEGIKDIFEITNSEYKLRKMEN